MAFRPLAGRLQPRLKGRCNVVFLRSSLQQRFASNEPNKLVGPMDNAFNRERLAVKQHAKQSAGMTDVPMLERFH